MTPALSFITMFDYSIALILLFNPIKYMTTRDQCILRNPAVAYVFLSLLSTDVA